MLKIRIKILLLNLTGYPVSTLLGKWGVALLTGRPKDQISPQLIFLGVRQKHFLKGKYIQHNSSHI